MNESPTSAPRSGKRRRWLRFVVKFFGVLILLLVVAWFVVTSSVFFKSFILPRVSKAANATITVDEAVISPFSHIILRNLKVQTTGAEPLVTAAEVRIRYHLVDILCGNFNVDEVALVSPTINLVKNPDGSSNLDPLLKSQSKETKTSSPAKNSKSSKPFRVDLKKFTLTDATIREIKNFSGGQSDTTEVSNVNITLDNVKNGESSKLQLSADAKIDDNPPAPAAKGNLQAKVAGNFTFALADDLKPLSIQGNTHLDVTQAGGAMQDFAALGVNFDCEITPTNITQIALHFQKSGAQLGALQVSGPFDMEKTEGRLNVGILGLDRRVLNLFGAASGIDFGGTTINSMNHIELAKSGSVITAAGQFTVAGLQMTRAGQTTPTLDATADYNVSVDRAAQTALLNTLTLTATQNRNPLAHAELSNPMNICWGDTNAAGGDATLNLAITRLNLADWKPFLGGNISGGNVDFNAKLASQSNGKQLAFDIGSQITNLTANFSGNRISQADLDLRVRGQATDFKQFKWDECRLQVARENQPLLTVSATGTCEPAAQNTDLQVQLQTALPGLLKLLPQASANLSSGTLDLSGHITQKDQAQTVTSTLTLTALTGYVGKNEFHNFGVTANLNATNDAGQIQISRLEGQLTGDGINGGNFQVSGTYDLKKKSGQWTAKLADFNENGLRPFLEPLLEGKKLNSISLNADADAQFDLQNNDAVKADLQVTNLVVNDPAGKFPATPLEAKVQLDVSVNKQVADLHQLQITLTPTARAKNELQLAGTVDFSKTNAIAGNLKLTADALDVTRYYNLFANQPKPAATALPPTAATSTVTTNLNLEPAAMNLPFENFTVDAAIGQFYLDEVDVSNLQATVKFNDSRVLLSPFQLFLNGAPVTATADLNLGVPGYQYNVSANADRIPIAPLADTFSPAYKNKAKGDLLANIQVKGAGITGAGLKKNLTGHVGLVLTNANIQLVGPKAKKIITPFAVVLGLNELLSSPLSGLNAQIKMGDGKITLAPVIASSAAFQANVSGDISLTSVLTNSTLNDLPVNVSLARNLANKLRLVSAATPTKAAFVSLPNFATLGGTLGNPVSKIDKKIVAGLLAKSVIGVAGNVVDGTTGNALNKIAGLLNGGASSSTNMSTNQPAKTAPINKLLNFFRKK